MFEIGQVLTKANYTAAAVWCNANSAHIEKQNGAYVIVANAPAPEPTAEGRVYVLEARYGLPRASRTALLALRGQGVQLDETLMARVDEVEALARELRAGENTAQEGEGENTINETEGTW